MQKLLSKGQALQQDIGVLLISGVPNSGKTTIISEILEQKSKYLQDFDLYLVISPSTIPGCDNNENYYNQKFCIAWLIDRIDTIRNLIEEQKKSIKLLIIFDDVVLQLKKHEQNEFLGQLFFNRRHVLPRNSEIKIIVTTQRYTKFPTIARSAATNFIICRQSFADWDEFRRENASFSIKEGKEIFNNYLVWSQEQKPHIFVTLEPFQMYDYNGQKILLEQTRFVIRKEQNEQYKIQDIKNQPQQKKSLRELFY